MTFTTTKIRGALKDLPGDKLRRDEWALALGDPTELDDEAASADVHCAGVVHADRPVVVAPERLSSAPARGQQAGHLGLHVPLSKVLSMGNGKDCETLKRRDSNKYFEDEINNSEQSANH